MFTGGESPDRRIVFKNIVYFTISNGTPTVNNLANVLTSGSGVAVAKVKDTLTKKEYAIFCGGLAADTSNVHR